MQSDGASVTLTRMRSLWQRAAMCVSTWHEHGGRLQRAGRERTVIAQAARGNEDGVDDMVDRGAAEGGEVAVDEGACHPGYGAARDLVLQGLVHVGARWSKNDGLGSDVAALLTALAGNAMCAEDEVDVVRGVVHGQEGDGHAWLGGSARSKAPEHTCGLEREGKGRSFDMLVGLSSMSWISWVILEIRWLLDPLLFLSRPMSLIGTEGKSELL